MGFRVEKYMCVMAFFWHFDLPGIHSAPTHAKNSRRFGADCFGQAHFDREIRFPLHGCQTPFLSVFIEFISNLLRQSPQDHESLCSGKKPILLVSLLQRRKIAHFRLLHKKVHPFLLLLFLLHFWRRPLARAVTLQKAPRVAKFFARD